MLEIVLKGHESYYALADVVRLFFPSPAEDRENGKVFCAGAPDFLIESELLPSG